MGRQALSRSGQPPGWASSMSGHPLSSRAGLPPGNNGIKGGRPVSSKSGYPLASSGSRAGKGLQDAAAQLISLSPGMRDRTTRRSAPHPATMKTASTHSGSKLESNPSQVGASFSRDPPLSRVHGEREPILCQQSNARGCAAGQSCSSSSITVSTGSSLSSGTSRSTHSSSRSEEPEVVSARRNDITHVAAHGPCAPSSAAIDVSPEWAPTDGGHSSENHQHLAHPAEDVSHSVGPALLQQAMMYSSSTSDIPGPLGKPDLQHGDDAAASHPSALHLPPAQAGSRSASLAAARPAADKRPSPRIPMLSLGNLQGNSGGMHDKASMPTSAEGSENTSPEHADVKLFERQKALQLSQQSPKKPSMQKSVPRLALSSMGLSSHPSANVGAGSDMPLEAASRSPMRSPHQPVQKLALKSLSPAQESKSAHHAQAEASPKAMSISSKRSPHQMPLVPKLALGSVTSDVKNQLAANTEAAARAEGTANSPKRSSQERPLIPKLALGSMSPVKEGAPAATAAAAAQSRSTSTSPKRSPHEKVLIPKLALGSLSPESRSQPAANAEAAMLSQTVSKSPKRSPHQGAPIPRPALSSREQGSRDDSAADVGAAGPPGGSWEAAVPAAPDDTAAVRLPEETSSEDWQIPTAVYDLKQPSQGLGSSTHLPAPIPSSEPMGLLQAPAYSAAVSGYPLSEMSRNAQPTPADSVPMLLNGYPLPVSGYPLPSGSQTSRVREPGAGGMGLPWGNGMNRPQTQIQPPLTARSRLQTSTTSLDPEPGVIIRSKAAARCGSMTERGSPRTPVRF